MEDPNQQVATNTDGNKQWGNQKQSETSDVGANVVDVLTTETPTANAEAASQPTVPSLPARDGNNSLNMVTPPAIAEITQPEGANQPAAPDLSTMPPAVLPTEEMSSVPPPPPPPEIAPTSPPPAMPENPPTPVAPLAPVAIPPPSPPPVPVPGAVEQPVVPPASPEAPMPTPAPPAAVSQIVTPELPTTTPSGPTPIVSAGAGVAALPGTLPQAVLPPKEDFNVAPTHPLHDLYSSLEKQAAHGDLMVQQEIAAERRHQSLDQIEQEALGWKITGYVTSILMVISWLLAVASFVYPFISNAAADEKSRSISFTLFIVTILFLLTGTILSIWVKSPKTIKLITWSFFILFVLLFVVVSLKSSGMMKGQIPILDLWLSRLAF